MTVHNYYYYVPNTGTSIRAGTAAVMPDNTIGMMHKAQPLGPHLSETWLPPNPKLTGAQ